MINIYLTNWNLYWAMINSLEEAIIGLARAMPPNGPAV